MTFAHGLLVGQALGWIECLAALTALGAVTIYVIATGRFPRLKWPGHEASPDE